MGTDSKQSFLVDVQTEILSPSGVSMVPCEFSGREAARKGTGNNLNTT
jgi:hypothetical protein